MHAGRAFEVWADPAIPEDGRGGWGSRPSSVMSRYSQAWDEYLHQNSIDRKEGVRLRPRLDMYSVDFLMAEGRREYAEQLLGEARVADLPDLQARAELWIRAYRKRLGHP